MFVLGWLTLRAVDSVQETAHGGVVCMVRATRPVWPVAIGVWALASCLLLAAYVWMEAARPELLLQGFKWRDEGSDTAWQTIRPWELWIVGPRALWLMHIYPPLYDSIRWLLMQPEVWSGRSPSATNVDHRLYVMNALLFGLIAMVVFLWVRDLTGSGCWGIVSALAWCLLPSSSAFMTLLNQTGLAIAAIAVAFYFLYRFCRTRANAYAAGFLAALLVASLTRNVVQLHVGVVVALAAISFHLMGRPRRLGWLAVNVGLVALILFWPIRAYVMFSTFDVSAHTGYNRAGALWSYPKSVSDPQWPANILENGTLLSSGWNTQETLRDNFRLGSAANDLLTHHPIESVKRMAESLALTAPVMVRSIYVQWYNAFLSVYPLAHALDWVWSGLRLASLFVFSVLVVGASLGWRGIVLRIRRYAWLGVFWILTAIPVALSNRFWPPDVPEPVHSEADRLRGLIEVPVFVLMAYAVTLTCRAAVRAVHEHRRPSAA
jgi:hypothetical protein